MKRLLLILCSLVLFAPFLLAQGSQSGSLTGTVTSGGSPIPGVTVTIGSPAMQGKRTQTTGSLGEYVFKFLPPGAYTVVFELPGMRSVTQVVTLELGASLVSDAALEPSASEDVLVTAEATEIQKAAVHEKSLDYEEVQALPIGRTIDQIASLAPAVTTNTPNAGQLKINGGFAYDNVFLVDGADVDDHYFTTPTNALIIEEAIEETQVLTSAISAEFGRFSGGVINAITKSGGNDYHGSARIDLTNDAWQAESPFEIENGIERPSKVNQTYTGVLGGKIIEDRLWFFVAGRYFKNENQVTLPVTGATFISTDEEPRIEGKLTLNINQSHTLAAAYTYSKETVNDVAFSTTIDPNAVAFPNYPASLWVASYHGVLSNNLFAAFQASEKKFEFAGAGGTSTNIVDSPFVQTDPISADYNAPYFDSTDPEFRNNLQFTGSLNYFLTTSKLGTHDVKLGGEYFRTTSIGGNSQSATGFVFYYVPYAQDADGNPIYDSNGRIQPVFTPFPDAVQLLLNWLPIRGAKAHINTTSVYLNDSWKVTPQLSANLGVRYEHVTGEGPTGAPLTTNHSWVPRLGAAYDILGDGRYVVSGSYSEYVGGANPNNFQRSTNVGNPDLVYYLYVGPEGQGRDFAPGFDLSNYELVGGTFPAITVSNAADLKSPVNREFTVSAGGQFTNQIYGGMTYINRKLRNFIDEFTTFDMGATEVIVDGNNFGFFDNSEFQNTDLPERRYSALALQSRYSLGTRFFADLSYTYMIDFEGNYEGEGVNQPAITPGLGSYPEILVPARNNPVGRMNGYQKHKVRLLTHYNMPTSFGNFGLGMVYRFDSGTPYSFVANGQPISDVQAARDPGYATPPTSQSIYFGERGSQIFPSRSAFDLALNYDIPVFKTISPWVKATVTNVFNTAYRTGFATGIVPCYTPDQAGCGGEAPLDADGLPTTFRLASSFGQGRSNADFQTARRFILSAGVRF